MRNIIVNFVVSIKILLETFSAVHRVKSVLSKYNVLKVMRSVSREVAPLSFVL